ncbi:MAG TPA: 3'-5' exonuclease [Kofleriaceae bacterium]|nr:3'-5' exonuclease [Kofleriaceae bacterium]
MASPIPMEGGIIVFDVETTGTDKRSDQIIELCVQLGLAHQAPTRVWRIKPDVPISPGAQAVHGISMQDLEDCPKFSEVADEVCEVIARADVLVGYNVAFDIDMIQAELARMGAAPVDLSEKKIVDAFRLWQQCEPRSLQDAHRRFVGAEFACAHSAAADVSATGRVLLAMVEAFGLEGKGWNDIARVCEPDRRTWIGPTRHIRRGEDGLPILGFGRHAGAPLLSLAQGEGRGYLRWIIGRDFPPHVRDICQKLFELTPAEFLPWLESTYGMAAEPSSRGNAAEKANPTTQSDPQKRRIINIM